MATRNYPIIMPTHPPEQTLRWSKMVKSNPKRVADALVVQLNIGKNSWGDTTEDVAPAQEVVQRVAQAGGKEWEDLVRAGVVDTLCQSVRERVMEYSCPYDMPAHVWKEVIEPIPSPYYTPLEILYLGSVDLLEPPKTAVKTTMVSALTKGWDGMMERIWDEPEATLKPTEPHDLERRTVPCILYSSFRIDSALMKEIDKPKDRTIKIMSRFLMHSVNLNDFTMNCEALREIVEPRMEPTFTYRESHPRKYSVIARILEGVKGESADMFLSKMAGPLNGFMSGRALRTGLRLLTSMLTDASIRCKSTQKSGSETGQKENQVFKREGKDGEFVLALLRSNALWKSLFFLLGRTATHPSLQEEEMGDTIMSLILRITGDVVVMCNTMLKDESERLLITLTSAGMFAAFDQALPICGTYNDVPKLVATTFTVFRQQVIRNPRLRTILRPQFPRQRMFLALLSFLTKSLEPVIDYTMKLTPEDLPRFNPFTTKSKDAFIEGAWAACDLLQKAVLQEGLGEEAKKWCMRRGCKNDGDKNCSRCQKVTYCSAECQKADWKEHKQLCPRLKNVDVFFDIMKSRAAGKPMSHREVAKRLWPPDGFPQPQGKGPVTAQSYGYD